MRSARSACNVRGCGCRLCASKRKKTSFGVFPALLSFLHHRVPWKQSRRSFATPDHPSDNGPGSARTADGNARAELGVGVKGVGLHLDRFVSALWHSWHSHNKTAVHPRKATTLVRQRTRVATTLVRQRTRVATVLVRQRTRVATTLVKAKNQNRSAQYCRAK